MFRNTRSDVIRNNVRIAQEALERAMALYGAEYNARDALGLWMENAHDAASAVLEVIDRFEREGRIEPFFRNSDKYYRTVYECPECGGLSDCFESCPCGRFGGEDA